MASISIDGFAMLAGPRTAEEIIFEISQVIQQSGQPYPRWYVGIASQPIQRLFDDHGVDDNQRDRYIYRRSISSLEARQIEKHFLLLGTDGGPGGGSEATEWVYAYQKGISTKP